MDLSPDEFAGIADLFGGLTREELAEAVENLAARQGVDFGREALDARVETARLKYYLLAVQREGETVLAPGPTALPTLPDHAEDLPHMMEVSERAIDPERLAEAVHERLAADAERAIANDERDRIDVLIGVSYDAEAWGPVELEDIREQLRDSLEAG
jgi:hypothetical protein